MNKHKINAQKRHGGTSSIGTLRVTISKTVAIRKGNENQNNKAFWKHIKLTTILRRIATVFTKIENNIFFTYLVQTIITHPIDS